MRRADLLGVSPDKLTNLSDLVKLLVTDGDKGLVAGYKFARDAAVVALEPLNSYTLVQT